MTIEEADITNALHGVDGALGTSDFDLNGDFGKAAFKVRPAAVLVALRETSVGLTVVLTKRSSHLKHHPGQIAFAGGKVDADDANPQAAALREAQEEIGLARDDVRIIGTLPNHITVTGFDVHPYVGIIEPGFTPVPELGEVDEVFEVPLQHVLDPKNFLVEGRFWRGQMRRYFVVPYGPYYIWGATARMLRMFAELMAKTDAD